MPESDRFLADIVAEPQRDEPRLAYAAWLTGQKDPRGEFIRIQVELARSQADEVALSLRERKASDRTKLLQREKLLLKKHADDWNRELPEWARHHAPGFYRGFPEVRCDVADWVRGAAALAARFPLHRVNMKATAKTLPKLAHSAELRHVELLDLSYSPLDDTSVAAFVASTHLRELTALYLWHCGLGAEAARAIAESPQLANLRKLQLEENRITAEGAAALACSPHLRQLSYLSLRSNHFGPEGGKALAGAGLLNSLVSLNVGNNDIGPEFSVSFLSKTPGQLQRLDFEGNAMGDAGARALAAASHVDKLASLDISFNQLSSAGATVLAQARHLASLTELRIGANRLGAAGVKALAQSTVFANLEELNLDAADVGDEGAVAIVESRVLTRLRALGLWDAQIGTAGAQAIAAAPSLETLESLSLFGNPFAKECRSLLRKRFGKRVSL